MLVIHACENGSFLTPLTSKNAAIAREKTVIARLEATIARVEASEKAVIARRRGHRRYTLHGGAASLGVAAAEFAPPNGSGGGEVTSHARRRRCRRLDGPV